MVVVTPSVVTAVFNNRVEADLAVIALTETVGIRRDCVSFLSADGSIGYPRPTLRRRGVLDIVGTALKNSELGSIPFYAEALRRGDAVVLVRVNGGDAADLVSDMLKQCGATDIDAR